MKHLDEYRNPGIVNELMRRIKNTAAPLGRKISIMEVCGGQTHNLARFGIEQQLSPWIRMIHGPGCPVCVTPTSLVDDAATLSHTVGVQVFTFGDMMRVPGSRGSLLQARAQGGHVRVVLSPLEAVEWAHQNPERKAVFFAIGFETTAPVNALAMRQAERLGLTNFYLLVAQVRILPVLPIVLTGLGSDHGHGLDGLLAAGHVCAVTGYAAYEELSQRHNLPIVITGFEPVDLLRGILRCVSACASGARGVWNEYPRAVQREGNRRAQELLDQVFQVDDVEWRGMGVIPRGGYRLTARYAAFDARTLLVKHAEPAAEKPQSAADGGLCAAVLLGRLKPSQCAEFGVGCHPDAPKGAPMVSEEGACSAWFRYRNALRAEPAGRELPW